LAEGQILVYKIKMDFSQHRFVFLASRGGAAGYAGRWPSDKTFPLRKRSTSNFKTRSHKQACRSDVSGEFSRIVVVQQQNVARLDDLCQTSSATTCFWGRAELPIIDPNEQMMSLDVYFSRGPRPGGDVSSDPYFVTLRPTILFTASTLPVNSE
jgi:hypothetical protein